MASLDMFMDGSRLLLLFLGILFAVFSFFLAMIILMCIVLKQTHERIYVFRRPAWLVERSHEHRAAIKEQ